MALTIHKMNKIAREISLQMSECLIAITSIDTESRIKYNLQVINETNEQERILLKNLTIKEINVCLLGMKFVTESIIPKFDRIESVREYNLSDHLKEICEDNDDLDDLV